VPKIGGRLVSDVSRKQTISRSEVSQNSLARLMLELSILLGALRAINKHHYELSRLSRLSFKAAYQQQTRPHGWRPPPS
jgi:hypothetical protein